jgi:hypothetical protein
VTERAPSSARSTTSMIETRTFGEEPEPTHLVRVVPALVAEPRFPALRVVLWWVLPAMAMLAGAWAAASVLVAARGTRRPAVRTGARWA